MNHAAAACLALTALLLPACSTPAPQLSSRSEVSLSSSVPRATGVVKRRLWTGKHVDFMGRPSPDGRLISFTDWETGDLAVHDVVTGEDRRLTHKGAWSESVEYAEFSVFSPDGRRIAYAWFNKVGYDLRIVGLDGSEPRVLFTNENLTYIWPAAWSPDGSQIVATLFRKDGANQIALISTGDGSVRVLKSLDWRYPQGMSFSPDGRSLVYDLPVADDSLARDIHVLALDANRETRVVAHPANDQVLGWAPDGGRLLFASDRGGLPAIWAVAVSGGRLSGEPELIVPDMWRMVGLGLSRTAFFYGVSIDEIQAHTATVDLETGQLLTAPTPVGGLSGGQSGAADWSPDGRRLAYVVQPTRGSGGLAATLVIRSAERGEVRDIRLDLSYVGRTRWAPDGNSVLLQGIRRVRQGFYHVDLETGKTTVVVTADPTTFGVRDPTWSPDGRTVYYSRSGPDSAVQGVVARDFATGTERMVFRNSAGNLSLSPDGRQLAFVTYDRTEKTQSIVVMPATGGEPRFLHTVRAPDGVGATVWMPDGRSLLFLKRTDQVEGVELWRLPVSRGEPRKLFTQPNMIGIRVHPDGRQIAFTGGVFKGEVWMLDLLSGSLGVSK